MRFATLLRATALGVIMAATAGILATHTSAVPVVAADYLVKSDIVATELSPPAMGLAETETLTDWEYTLRARPAKCRFIP